MGLSDKLKEFPDRLRGGQQQRVAIARVLAMQPKLILFDEPTSSLDPELVGEVLNVMRRLAEQGRTMIIVTHEIEFAGDVADRMIFMADGKIVEAGSPSEILRKPAHKRTARLPPQTPPPQLITRTPMKITKLEAFPISIKYTHKEVSALIAAKACRTSSSSSPPTTGWSAGARPA